MLWVTLLSDASLFYTVIFNMILISKKKALPSQVREVILNFLRTEFPESRPLGALYALNAK
jgi:hypothetical protein